MIYSSPVGGFGNILFQLAALWTLAKDNNDELCLLDIDNRLQGLINYAVPVKHAFEYKYILNRLPQSDKGCLGVIQHPFTFTPIKYMKDIQYVGFFQCENYFKHRRNEILELYKPTDEISDRVNKYSDLFGNISYMSGEALIMYHVLISLYYHQWNITTKHYHNYHKI